MDSQISSRQPYQGLSTGSRSKSKKKTTGATTSAKKALEIVQRNAASNRMRAEVQKALKKEVELKYFAIADNTYGAVSYNGTDFFQAMCNVPQGDTDQDRDGDRLHIVNLHYRIGIKTGTTTPTFLRIVCFQWYPQSVPVYATIFIDQHNTSNAPLTDFNHDTRDQYHILSDDLVQVDNVAHPACCVERHIKSGFRPNVQYVAGSTTAMSNQLFISCTSDVAANGPQVVLSAKLLFTDA